jgi:hypothetical protein
MSGYATQYKRAPLLELGPTTAKRGPETCHMTQNKARQGNKIVFLRLPWAQEGGSSNLHAPTTYCFIFNSLLFITNALLPELGSKYKPRRFLPRDVAPPGSPPNSRPSCRCWSAG